MSSAVGGVGGVPPRRGARGWRHAGPIATVAVCACWLAVPVAAAGGQGRRTAIARAVLSRAAAKPTHRKTVVVPRLPTVLPAGATVRGTWAAAATNYESTGATQYAYATISYPIPAATRPQTVWVPASAPYRDRAHCPGSSTSPRAARGYLCIYDASGASTPTVFDPSVSTGTGAGRFGAVLAFAMAPDASVYAYGTWALTVR